MSNDQIQNDENTVFTQLEAQFPDSEEQIKTMDFLNASSGAVSLVEKFGKLFSPVIFDMNGNIKKLTDKYNENKESYLYLEDMILDEQNHQELVAIDALLWLRRALHFLSVFFQFIIDNTSAENVSQDLQPFLKSAYSDTLEPHHGWLGTQLFNVLARFAPSRRNLLFVLGNESSNKEEQVIQDMKKYTDRMMACVRKLITFYVENQLENVNL